MKPSDLSEFFNLLGKAKKEKEEEFDNLLKEADINLDDLTSSLVSGIKEAKEDQKKQKKNEEKLIEQLDSIIDVIENPKEVKDITEPAVTVGVPENFDVTTLEDADDKETVEIIDIIKPEPIKTPEISDTVAQAIKFIEETNIKEEIENSDDTNLDKLKTEIKQVRDILYKVLAHGPGSGEVNLLKLDDVDEDTAKVDGKFLKYDESSGKFVGADASGGGSGGITVQDEGSSLSTSGTTLNFVGSGVVASGTGATKTITISGGGGGGSGITTANVRTGILDVAGIATFRSDTLIGSGISLSPDGDVFATGVTTSSSFVGDLTGDVTGTASNATQLNSQAASYYLDYDNFSNTPTIPTNNNQLTNGAGYITTSFTNTNQLTNGAGFITASDDITGNAATSTKLATARTIAGVSFDGSANISLNNNAITNGAGYITTSFTNTNQLTNGAGFITASDDITGNAATSTKLATARTIAGVSFDGSANISLNNNAITNGAGYITTSFTNTNQLTNGAGFIDGSALNASNLSSGTIPDARFPSTLPAIDGSALTGIAGTANVRTGILDVAGVSTFRDKVNIAGGKDLQLLDNGVIRLGDASNTTDFQMSHDGNHTRFNNGTGNLYLNNSSTNGSIRLQPKDGENGLIVRYEGAVQAYYNNSLKLETSNTGVTITGTAVATSFTGDLTGDVTGDVTGSGANLTDLNADRIASGTVPDARFPSTLPATSGENLTSLNATNLGSGTVPDDRFPSTLPAVSGANLSNLNADRLASGTIPDARFPSVLPAIDGSNLTNISASGDITAVVAGTGLSGGATSGSATLNLAVALGEQVAVFRHKEANNTNTGSFTAGSDQTRTLNFEEHNDISGASLNTSTGEFNLPAGTYLIYFSASAFDVTNHRAKIVTDGGTNKILGDNARSHSGDSTTTASFGMGVVTNASTEGYFLKHRCSTTRSTKGFGLLCNFDSEEEFYATVVIFKMA